MSTKSPLSGSFVSQLSPITGLIQWNLVSDTYDYEQEIARSAYADMLHDYDRNRRYHEAIRHVITSQKALGKPTHVLDIGTGTGLLSMMAASAGADSVVACEAFRPMAACAQRIIEANGLASKIKIARKRSTEMVVGRDLPQRANILVAELFDTELIGEMALETYRHAAENLLTPDAILIPNKARMYLQVVESPALWSHNRIDPYPALGSDDTPVSSISFPTRDMFACSGCPAVFDLQVSRLRLVVEGQQSEPMAPDDAAIRCLLTEPIMFHEFNFSPPASNMQQKESKRLVVNACSPGVAHAIVVWWDLQMEPSNTVPSITMAPNWAPLADTRATRSWREHWMQAVYFPRQPLSLLFHHNPHLRLAITFAHDGVSMWFDLQTEDVAGPATPERPVCMCLTHMCWPRPRIAELNSLGYRRHAQTIATRVHQMLEVIQSDSIVIVHVSDASILPLLVHQTCGGRRIHHQFHLECTLLSARLMESVYKNADVGICVKGSAEDLLDELKTLAANSPTPLDICVVAEPHVLTAVLPWNSIHFWYLCGRIRQELPTHHCHLLTPKRMRIWAVAMEFEHLWKIRAPVGEDCEGFDLRLFDELILSACDATDAPVEAQPLWEYAGKARSDPKQLISLDLQEPPAFSGQETIPMRYTPKVGGEPVDLQLSSSSTNAIAMWVEWEIDKEHRWNVGGPVEPVAIGQEVDWCKYGSQTGMFLLRPKLIDQLKTQCVQCSLRVTTEFDIHSGEPRFSVEALSTNRSPMS